MHWSNRKIRKQHKHILREFKTSVENSARIFILKMYPILERCFKKPHCQIVTEEIGEHIGPQVNEFRHMWRN